jgi:hypothetical protein
MTSSSQLRALRSQFDGVAATLGDQLAAASPRFVTLVAKWSKDDLIPGLSDMDFRVVCEQQTTAEDWVHIDRHVGRIHRQMVADHPEWNRLNEHTAGAGVNIAELRGDRFHHPEYAVWSSWWGPREWVAELQARTLARPLCAIDEHYHLARFLAYYSPYRYDIDPPINLGALEPKYALHSRCWHYFAPPMLSAATLLAGRHFPGKREGLSWLANHGFAAPQTLAVLAQVDAHYDTPEQRDSNRLVRFEQFLFTAFDELFESVCASVQTLALTRRASPREVQNQLADASPDPLVKLLDHVRYARIRAGRYYFYLNAPAHFHADRQLLCEQAWTRKLFGAIAESLSALLGEAGLSIAQCITRLEIEPTDRELSALGYMKQLAALPAGSGDLRAAYGQAVQWYPDFYRLVERACERLCSLEPVSMER